LKLGKIYEFVVREGILCDPRSRKRIMEQLRIQQRKFRLLKKDEKREFDVDNLKNPYADTRILYGNPDTEIKTILVGIDIDVAEILLADRLNSNGKGIDLVLSHHPRGYAWAGFFEVMNMQKDMLINLGIDANIAKDFVSKRIEEVERGVISSNHNRAIDVARILDIPFMCVHTPSDNHVHKYINDFIKKKKPKTLKELINILKQLPEYKLATKDKAGPKIFIGKPEDKVGRIILEMTGGTEGSKEIFGRLSQLGIDTIVSMHLSESHFKKVKPEHINVVIAGHIASDTIGLNLLLDKLEKKDEFEFIECSGFRRIRR
jgi:putative NIF3 family GTP cyclohydrolase 1 type 2